MDWWNIHRDAFTKSIHVDEHINIPLKALAVTLAVIIMP